MRRDPGRASSLVFPPPPVHGLGTLGGFKMQLEDRGDLGYDALQRGDAGGACKRASQAPELGRRCSPSYQINVPQLFADLDRVKAKQLGVPLTDVFDTTADLSRLAVCERLQPVSAARTRCACRRTRRSARSAEDIGSAEDAQRRAARWCRCRRS